MKTLLIGLAFAHSGLAAQPPAQPALYSFADVYRLTVAGPMGGLPLVETPEAPIRVSVQAPAAEPRFSVAPAPQPDTWLMVLAGLAAAGWVAHRRLVRSL